MERLRFTMALDAPAARVWRAMLDDAGYREWTSEFQEGSYAVTDWKEGSKALFLTPAGEGMVSRIVTHRPNEFLSIEHLGIVKNGVEEIEGDAVKDDWAGAREEYSLREIDGGSRLTVEMDVTDEYRKYFEETWPKALGRLKRLCERGLGRPAA